jgi:hypothetical protein
VHACAPGRAGAEAEAAVPGAGVRGCCGPKEAELCATVFVGVQIQTCWRWATGDEEQRLRRALQPLGDLQGDNDTTSSTRTRCPTG